MPHTRQWLAVALALLAQAAAAADFAALKPEGYVSDFAQVLDQGTRAQLEGYCARLEQATGAQMALVTLQSLYGEPVEDVANALFRKWGVGQKGANEGILLLLAIGDRRSRLEVGYGLEPIIPDGYAGSILRLMRPSLKENRYGEALLTAAQEIGSRIAQGKGVSLDVRLPVRRRQRSEVPVPVWLFFGGFGIFWLLMAMLGGRGRRYHTGGGWSNLIIGLLLGNMLGRWPGSGGGGGGFGGFDSGDSFGGFGGGDSGGGGASGSW